jgi:peptidyl-prolyl cis-trans isomerase SurA
VRGAALGYARHRRITSRIARALTGWHLALGGKRNVTVHVTTHATHRRAAPAAARGTAHARAAAAVGASLALALAVLGWQPADLAAQSQPMKKSASASKSPEPEGVKTAPPLRSSGQGIVVVVNDEAITAYEIELRARFLALTANVGEQAKAHFERLATSDALKQKLKDLEREVLSANQGKSQAELIAIFKERQKQIGMSLQKQAVDSARAAIMPKLKKDARDELIDDRLKMQAAKKHGIEVSDGDAKVLLKDLAGRNKMTYDAFAQHLKGMGVDIGTMTEKFRAQKAWRELVTRRWGAQVSVSQRDIDQLLSAAAAEAGQDAVELQLQKLSLIVPGKADQAALTKRFAEAESLRRRFSGCKGMAELAKDTPDVKLHEMKFVKPSAIGEPTRSLLLSAKDNDVLPPVAAAGGVDLYAVCGRRTVAGNESLRSQAMAQLQAKQLDIFAQRHLRNLRQEANIEYK